MELVAKPSVPAEDPSAPRSAPSEPDLGVPRYRVLNRIGSGAMADVFRVLDRLTGRVATLKRGRNGLDDSPVAAAIRTPATGARLADEFRLHACLRHPNVVSVLDYGLDPTGRPYFTMDLEERAETIIDAGRGQPIAIQAELITQSLRSIFYLHRHAIIHRDLKPANLLVVRGQVKLLDLGLSTNRARVALDRGLLFGTPAYTAPELLWGESASERSDLYALGLIWYELHAGVFPFDTRDAASLFADIAHLPLPRPGDEIDPRFRPILTRLLAKDPKARYSAADQVIRDLEAALGQSLPVETIATRESFLQAAPFVGRSAELAVLDELISRTGEGAGSTVLIGGESGVGKSRLLEELRIRVSVRGMVVLRGQAVSQGGSPYHLWREVVAQLVLHSDLDVAEAAVLKQIVPSIGALLGVDVPDPPSLEPAAAQSRLLITVEQLFASCRGPVAVILDDLQWAGSESLKMLAWLSRAAEAMPVMIVAGYRSDEAPALARAVPDARSIALTRLSHDETAELCRSVIGARASDAEVVGLVQHESEGNPLFVVEVLRTLAESSGELGRIGEAPVAAPVVGGGMQRALRRRLAHVPPAAIEPLETAAVIGRAVDLELLAELHPGCDLTHWLDDCSVVAVLESVNGAWRFKHDRLREQLLEDLGAERRGELHQRVAHALERLRPGVPECVIALAHHWRGAGDESKEACYAEQAGFLALDNGACTEAVTYLERALALLTPRLHTDVPLAAGSTWLDPSSSIDPTSAGLELARLEAGLTESHFRLGHLAACRAHAERALARVGQPEPRGRVGWTIGLLGEVARRMAQRLARLPPRGDAPAGSVVEMVSRVEHRITEASFYALQAVPLIWAVLRVVNRGEAGGASPALAQAYMILAILAMTVPLERLASAWRRRAFEITERTGDQRDLGVALSRAAVIDLGTCAWDRTEPGVRRAIRIAEEVGDVRLLEEGSSQLAAHCIFVGRYQDGIDAMARALSLARRSGNKQTECWARLGTGDMLVRLGRCAEALPCYEEGLAIVDERTTASETIWGLGMQSLALLRLGDPGRAFTSARGALALLETTQPLGYWTQHGTAATTETLLLLFESAASIPGVSRTELETSARRATRQMRRFAKRFPLGRPFDSLWRGVLADALGRRSRALGHWRRAVRRARALGTPYEEARAHYEIGRRTEADESEAHWHLAEARRMFEALGCQIEIGWIDAAP